MYSIRVPATTANLGAGFDSIGLAFKLYNHLDVCEQDNGLTIHIENPGKYVPETDEHNLIYRAFRRFFDETGKPAPGGVKLVQRDFIPQASGLGSSAACIVSGLLAANAMSGGNVGLDDIAGLAARMEGHPDNSTAAIFGGLTIGTLDGNKLEYVKLDVPRLSELAFAVIIPGFALPTIQSRGVLPESYPRVDAVFNISHAALTVAAFASGEFAKLKTAMRDRIHQPYRLPLVPGMEQVFSAAESAGALAAFLSGAGPAIIAVVHRDGVRAFEESIRGSIAGMDDNWTVNILEADTAGAVVEEI